MKRISLQDLGDMVKNGKLENLTEYCFYCKKISYPSEHSARLAGAEMRARGKGQTWSYECPKNNGFHLTSEKPIQGDLCSKQRKPSRAHRKRNDEFRTRSRSSGRKQ